MCLPFTFVAIHTRALVNKCSRGREEGWSVKTGGDGYVCGKRCNKAMVCRKLLNRTGSRLTGRFRTETGRTRCCMEPLDPEPDGTGTVGTGFSSLHWDQTTPFWARRHDQIFLGQLWG